MAKVGRPRKRRVKTSRPGVKLKQIARTGTWVARFTDPDTGRETQQSLDVLGKTNEESRREWCITKSESLRQRQADDAAGVVVRTETGVRKAVNEYLAGLTRKAPKTIQLYGQALDHLTTWARRNRIAYIEDLTGKHLTALGKYLHKLRAKAPAKGRKVGRGAQRQSARLLAPATVNQFVRGIRTFLTDCRRNELTSNLTGDLIRDRLPFVKRDAPLPVFLRARHIKSLLEVAQRHDAATFMRFRWQQGVTYPAIAPFVAGILLTGCRFSELASLRWVDVDLDAGEIRLDAGATKTRQGRIVNLRETPALAALLGRLKIQAAGNPFVFGRTIKDESGRMQFTPMRRALAEAARRRLIDTFGAPAFTWHDLRRTCGIFLTCAPGIYGGASAFMSAKRLGHSVTVSEKHYAGALSNLPAEARTLEDAMGCADQFKSIAGETVKRGAKSGVS